MKNILIEPIITEKVTTTLKKNGNIYGFLVDLKANKIEIAKYIEKKYNVKVLSVNTIRIKGKNKVHYTRKGKFTGNTGDIKKAIIKIPNDQKIDLLEDLK